MIIDELHAQRLELLRRRVAEGRYCVPAHELARKILERDLRLPGLAELETDD